MHKSCISKKKLYASVLGLFLTAAIPLCFSIAGTSGVYAAEKEEQQLVPPSCSHQQALPLEEIKMKGLGELVHLLWKEKASSEVKYEIIPNTSTETSSYNLGQALRTLYEKDPSINTWLAKITKAFPLPSLLWNGYTPPKYLEILPVLQQELIKDIGLTLYNLMHGVSVQLPSAFNSSIINYEEVVREKVENLEKIKRLANASRTIFSYMNVFIDLVKFQEEEVNNLLKANEEAYQQKKLEQKQALEKENKDIQDFITTTQQEITSWEESIAKLKISQTSNSTLGIFEKNVAAKKIEITKKQQNIVELEKKFEVELTLIKGVHENVVNQLKAKQHKTIKEKTILCSFMFDEVGTTGAKKILRKTYGLPSDRKDFDYAFFDKALLSTPSLLDSAQQMLENSLLEASKKSKAIIEDYTKEEIKAALIDFIKSPQRTQKIEKQLETVTTSSPSLVQEEKKEVFQEAVVISPALTLQEEKVREEVPVSEVISSKKVITLNESQFDIIVTQKAEELVRKKNVEEIKKTSPVGSSSKKKNKRNNKR